MFCPFCRKQNKENATFCAYCGKALPQKISAPQDVQPVAKANPSPIEESAPKPRLSYNAKRGIVTGLLIAVIIIVILVIYYPNIFHLNL
ncbi:MAG TPA: zinc ribbon domain-containing protein [Candidatus Bathyarchaeia archaeon]